MQNNEWNAQKYKQFSKSQEKWAKELLENISIDETTSVLDIGCGDGKVTNLFYQQGAKEVVGIDSSSNMISLAKCNYKKITFIIMDAQKIEFENKFNLIFSNAALHWVKNHEAIVQGVYKALKPNGKIVFQMGGYGNAKIIFQALEKTKQEYKEYFKDFSSPYTFHTDRYYDELLKKYGFIHKEVALIKKEMIHQDIQTFKGWLETTWFPYLNQLPQDLKGDFLEIWVENYLNICPVDLEKKVHVSMVRLEVKAIKGS